MELNLVLALFFLGTTAINAETTATKEAIDFNSLARQVFDEQNRVRAGNGTDAVDALFADAVMSFACNDLIIDQSQTGSIGHVTSDGSDAFERLSRYGTYQGEAAENVVYGHSTAKRVVEALLNSTLHRANVFGKAFKFGGVACGPHPTYSVGCCLNYAEQFVSSIQIFDPSIPSPSPSPSINPSPSASLATPTTADLPSQTPAIPQPSNQRRFNLRPAAYARYLIQLRKKLQRLRTKTRQDDDSEYESD